MRPLPAWASGIAVAGLAAAAYAATLGYGFVWDDPISVQRWLPALPNWWSAFFPPANIPQFPADYYRPLQLLSYRLDRAIGGGAPWAFHLDVVLLHVLATVLVLRTASRILDRPPLSSWAALWAAALFAVHPIHSESVAWMAARPDVMVTCAGLAALLAYWQLDWNPWLRSTLAAALIFVALLCKETAAALLIAIPASTFILRLAQEPRAQQRLRLEASAAVPFVVAGLAYLLLRSAGLEGGAVPHAVIPSNPIFAFIGVTGTYLRLLILPYPQSAYISDLSATGPALAASLVTVAAFAGLTWWSWRRADRALLFAFFWIAITLAPSLAVIAKPSTAPLAERYLYLPSVGFCWLAGLLIARAGRHPRFGLMTQVVAAALLVVAGWGTMQRNQVWRDNLSLWSDTAARNTLSGLPLRSLAAVTLERGDAAAAERMFQEALARSNDAHGQQIIYNNLGTIALNRGDDAAAESYYRQALTFERVADYLYNLGLIELRRSMTPGITADVRSAKQRAARSLFDEALASSPYDPDVHIGLAQTAEAMGDVPVARQHFEEALRLGLPPTTAAAVRRRLKEMKTSP